MLVSQVKDYAIFMLDTQGRIVSWNEGAQRIKGWTENEIVGQPITRFYAPEDQQRGHPARLLEIAKTEGRVEDEGWRVRKDGSRFWADVVITALRDEGGRLQGFAKVTRDLSERREAELALAELSARLLELQDDERRRISRELHDSTSPLLTGLMSRLHAAKMKAKGAEAGLTTVLDDAIASAEATATVIRSVAALLHPPLLDESGVLASLRWYAKTLSGRRDMKIDLDFPPTMERLPRDMEIALFRTVQESLGNIMQAVGAKHAKVQIRLKDRMLNLGIEGDGLPGGALAELRGGRGDLGIAVAGMRERMRKLGGKLLVSSEGGRLSISIALPLPEHHRVVAGQA
jgi:PAS domain S-box-containing protein